MTNPLFDAASLRDEIVGIDAAITTPFGERLMEYCDYTASGRSLRFIEAYLLRIQRHYANSHTEDDITGRSMTRILHRAERAIKEAVNAGPEGRILSVGFGSTAAIDRLQRIVGTVLPPATREMFFSLVREHAGPERAADLEGFIESHRPVVFIGPYEHHSNELTWREGLCTVVVVRLGRDGGIDLAHLEDLLRDPRYLGRMRIGSFSAASNVTGLISPVHELAAMLHRHGAMACFDYAASAPYVRIDMNPPPGPAGEDARLDAVFISPHKFLGGPGSSGILVFNERIYRKDLAPSMSGGGTVAYVSRRGHDFFDDVEEREKAGTPGVLQTVKAALTFMVKEVVSVEAIERREQELIRRAFAKWRAQPRLEIMGDPDPVRRIGVVSFNVRGEGGRYLHPKFVTVLLNDLFGIQSRAGCSCAGPYGHELLGIDETTSERYRAAIRQGFCGIKPGWCRVGFHFTMDDTDADYLIEAVDFVARRGREFLPLYRFDLQSGTWVHGCDPMVYTDLSLEDAFRAGDESPCRPLSVSVRKRLFRAYLDEAEALAAELRKSAPRAGGTLPAGMAEFQFFELPPET